MECNRDEALRAMTIAEEKFENKEFASAKKLALKAQTLYPGLEGISQILTTLDVYISAENKINGEVDWYGILGLNPSSDDETVRKQYRKLALVLHPDKNKSVGAEGAFKFLSEAWSLLSDKAKRLAYNQRRSINGFQQKVPMHASRPSAPPRTNGYHNSPNRTTSAPKNQNNSARVAPTSVPTPSHQRADTFWTICHRCKMHYEYVKMYLNHTLLCPNCNKAFLASETSSPFSFSKSSNLAPRQRHQNSSSRADSQNHSAQGRNAAAAQKSGPGHSGLNSFRRANFQQNSVPGNATKATNVVQQAQEKMKRAFTESNVTGGWEGESRKRKLDDRYLDGMNYNMTRGTGGFGSASSSGSRIYGSSGSNSQPNSSRELTSLEIRKMLMGKAQKEIVNRLSEWRLVATAKAADKKHKSTSNIHGRDHNGNSVLSTTNIGEQAQKGFVNSSADNSDKEDPAVASMNVPDPDFHDFDQDRNESSFGDNEVWASYDNDDGMPRFYALINKVISRNPFKLRISWLNSKTNSEFGPIEWVGSGFYKTCGEFRVGKYETCKSINSFSQKVNWSKGPHGTLQIFPKKDDVWALYKNWSFDWNEHTPDAVVHKYDMVMVLEDYNEEQGVSVAPLIKVVGFKTVFCPNLESEKVKRIPKEEMFRFSHQVPSHLLTGQEALNAPKGFLELDPAATPLELLQVLTETNEYQ
ncbi:DNAJ heat shock N-terminal domain-containing protein [Forsythia ovata]|uniref:DNAJ heat shock N-terminal domain-containing protein n=1 Tax=Forsythia ovata TaxID=205694 RepID=A0ABD1WM65_9LAMI